MLISKFSNKNIKLKIAEMEKEYEIILPDQYKNFLVRYNGGYTPKTKFRIGSIASDIRGFYGIGNVGLSFNAIELREWSKVGLLPVACDSFGNYIVIGLSNSDAGKIYFCNHENGNNADYIAESLKVFFNYCKSEKISDASRRSIKEREKALVSRGRGDIITDELRQMWQAEINKYKNMIQEEVIC